MASGNPVKPSQQAMNTSSTHGYLTSVRTFNQNLAPSFCDIHIPSNSFIAISANAKSQIYGFINY